MKNNHPNLPGWFKKVFKSCEQDKWKSDANLMFPAESNLSLSQAQTADSFGYQWSRRDLFDQENAKTQVRSWLIERFGLPDEFIKLDDKTTPILLDAGCGGGQSCLAYFEAAMLKNMHYIGCDVSSAVEIAKKRFEERQLKNTVFIQSDLNQIPLNEKSVDIIFSEGVLHHTDDARSSFRKLSTLLKPNGLIVFYIYKKKAPIREFVDDYIRQQLMHISPEEKFEKLLPLTKLGKKLGDLDIIITVDEPIDVLGIPSGPINLQHLFFYYIFKCFYKKDWSLEQMNLTNFDWYSPQNCTRHTKEEIREWMDENGFTIEREYIDDSGLSYIARKI